MIASSSWLSRHEVTATDSAGRVHRAVGFGSYGDALAEASAGMAALAANSARELAGREREELRAKLPPPSSGVADIF